MKRLFRVRWQIELLFKRLKSLLDSQGIADKEGAGPTLGVGCHYDRPPEPNADWELIINNVIKMCRQLAAKSTAIKSCR